MKKILAEIPEIIKEYSISEISSRIKELLEENFGYIKIRGEISGLKIATSGHGYFNLKDNIAVLSCTCWKPTLAKISFKLHDGIEVLVTGKITSYFGQSKYQLSVDSIQPAGIGAMMQILQERKLRLEQEGLFDRSIKKPIPLLPQKIGIITSISGAVIKDIITRIQDRYPTHLVIWPVAVQGESAAQEISEAINNFNLLSKEYRPQLLIVARGGGSIEDLWSFNEEIVVRSVYKSIIPVISAIGHETDYTLIDFVADLRAPTPTAAAEFAVPVRLDLQASLDLYQSKLLNSALGLIAYKQQIINKYCVTLKYSLNYISHLEQKLDNIGFDLNASLPNLIKIKNALLQRYNFERFNPERIVKYKALQLNHLFDNLITSMNKSCNHLQYRLHLSSNLLPTLDYKNVLKRGFALIVDDKGKIIKSKENITLDDKFNIRFSDGDVKAKKL